MTKSKTKVAAQREQEAEDAFSLCISGMLLRILPESVGDAVRNLYEQAWSDPTANADVCADELQERLHALLRAYFTGKAVKGA